jgi:putative transposase
VLGLWIDDPQRANFWLEMVSDLKRRGVADIIIACVEGTTGISEAIQQVFPATEIQLCIAHMVRRSLSYVPARARKAVVEDLKRIYQAPNIEEADHQLTAFAAKWDGDYLVISRLWRRNWWCLAPYFGCPQEIRKVIVATNAVEQVSIALRKVTNNRGSFSNNVAILKSLHLALGNIASKRSMPIRDWKSALNRFTVQFEDRMPVV